MEFIYEGLLSITPQQVIMYLVGLLLIYLAIKKEYEPALLLLMGFGAILVNLPLSGVINQTMPGIGEVNGIIEWLFNVGIEASEALPILLFIGIGAMIDFGPLLSQPIMFLFGAAAQFGIFFAICAAALMGFDLKDAASIGIIGAADGPTSILVSQVLGSRYVGPIAVAAYSYMALVPIVQPFAIRLVTTKKERLIRMPAKPSRPVTKTTRILFPIIVTFLVGLISPASVSLVGFLMFGNLLRECGAVFWPCCKAMATSCGQRTARAALRPYCPRISYGQKPWTTSCSSTRQRLSTRRIAAWHPWSCAGGSWGCFVAPNPRW